MRPNNQPTKQPNNYPIIEPLQIFCWTYWTFEIWRSAICFFLFLKNLAFLWANVINKFQQQESICGPTAWPNFSMFCQTVTINVWSFYRHAIYSHAISTLHSFLWKSWVKWMIFHSAVTKHPVHRTLHTVCWTFDTAQRPLHNAGITLQYARLTLHNAHLILHNIVVVVVVVYCYQVISTSLGSTRFTFSQTWAAYTWHCKMHT